MIDFLTLGDAAGVLGVRRVTLWRWIKEGRVVGYRIGREVLIARDAIRREAREFVQDTNCAEVTFGPKPAAASE